MPDDLDVLIAEGRAAEAERNGNPQPPTPAVQSASAASSPAPEPRPDDTGPSAAPSAAPESTLGSTLSGITDTASFGLMDEASGLLETLGVTAGTDAQSVWSSGKGFGDTLADNIAYERSLAKADASAHPYAYHGGQVAGGFLIPFGAGAKGALQVTRAAAIQGAVYGAGSGEGLEGRAAEAAQDGVLGAVGGAVLHPVLAGAAALGGKLRKLLVRTPKGDIPFEVPEGADEATIQAAGESAAQAGGITDKPEVAQGVVEGVAGHEVPVEAPPPEGQSAVPNAAWSQPDAQGNRQPVAPFEPIHADPAMEEAVPLHTEGTPEAPEGVPAGTISRAGLQDLQSSVEKLRAGVLEGDGRAVDITPSSPEHPTLGAFRLGNLGDDAEPMSLLGALTRQLDGLPKLSDQELASQVQAAAKDMAGGDHEALDALAKQIRPATS